MIQNHSYHGLIAACGMNCGICIGYLREKNPCGGCYKKDDLNKPKSCRSCIIVNCDALAKTDSGFCYECNKYPCSRLKQLDKRYRTNYGMSMIDNLNFICQRGMDTFLENEQSRWTCAFCGAGLSVHRDYCLNCKTKLKR
jgi:hypothetical protein